jgi:hypothetical protein
MVSACLDVKVERRAATAAIGTFLLVRKAV